MDPIPSKEKKKTDLEENLVLVGEKKTVLIGLKHPRINTDIKGPIMRMKKQLMDLRGFPEDNITLLIEDEPSCFQPTKSNIRHALCALVYHAHVDDILFIYLLAHGCIPGMIVTADKRLISDYFFRRLMGNRGCALTIVSDCQINELGVCGCRQEIKGLDSWNNELIRQILKRDTDFIYTGITWVSNFKLPPVDILKNEKSDDSVTPNSKTVMITLPKPSRSFFGEIGDMMLELFKSIFSPTQNKISDIPSQSSISNSPIHATLLTAFKCDKKDVTTPILFFSTHKVVFPTTNYLPSIVDYTLYGSFTNAMLDIMEETHGQVTNLELAQKRWPLWCKCTLSLAPYKSKIDLL